MSTKNENVRFNATSVDASIFVNEPSECRWSFDGSTDYDIMTNQMQCNTGLDEYTLQGWQCGATFPANRTGNPQTIYIRCKDQPWLVEDAGTGHSSIIINDGITQPAVGAINSGSNEEGDNVNGFNDPIVDTSGAPATPPLKASATKHRNKMMESYPYVIKKNDKALNIDYIHPNNETLTFGGVDKVTVNFEVGTSGGTPDYIQCSYQWGDNPYISFDQTLANVHRQSFNTISEGERLLPIRCEDFATGEIADSVAAFNITIDSTAPGITRVYQQSGLLKVITNDNALCYYSTEKCDFDIANGIIMSGNSLEHSFSFNPRLTYNLKCKDQYDNTPGICEITVKGQTL